MIKIEPVKHMSKLQNIRLKIISDCYNKDSKLYMFYGANKISVCKRWLVRPGGLANFIEDMSDGYGQGLYLSRIDITKNFNKDNCYWSKSVQVPDGKTRSCVVCSKNIYNLKEKDEGGGGFDYSRFCSRECEQKQVEELKKINWIKKNKYSDEPTYQMWKLWKDLKCRCLSDYYENNITLCDRWIGVEDGRENPDIVFGFKNFIEDMGESYFLGARLRRINNKDGYYKGNCVWITKEESYRVNLDESKSWIDAVEKKRKTPGIDFELNFCERCGGKVPKPHWLSIKRYEMRRFCSRKCFSSEVRDVNKGKTEENNMAVATIGGQKIFNNRIAEGVLKSRKGFIEALKNIIKAGDLPEKEMNQIKKVLSSFTNTSIINMAAKNK